MYYFILYTNLTELIRLQRSALQIYTTYSISTPVYVYLRIVLVVQTVILNWVFALCNAKWGATIILFKRPNSLFGIRIISSSVL